MEMYFVLFGCFAVPVFGLRNEKRTAVLSGQLRDEGRLVGAAEIGGAGNQHNGTVFLYDGSGDGINAAVHLQQARGVDLGQTVPQSGELGHHMGHEFLTAETGPCGTRQGMSMTFSAARSSSAVWERMILLPCRKNCSRNTPDCSNTRSCSCEWETS